MFFKFRFNKGFVCRKQKIRKVFVIAKVDSIVVQPVTFFEALRLSGSFSFLGDGQLLPGDLSRPRWAVKGGFSEGEAFTLDCPSARGMIFTQVEATENSSSHVTVITLNYYVLAKGGKNGQFL